MQEVGVRFPVSALYHQSVAALTRAEEVRDTHQGANPWFIRFGPKTPGGCEVALVSYRDGNSDDGLLDAEDETGYISPECNSRQRTLITKRA